MACVTCRARKIKCDRTRPTCLNCRLRASHCTYAGERRKRRWTNSKITGDQRLLSTPSNQATQSRNGQPVESGDQAIPTIPGYADGSDTQLILGSENDISKTNGINSTSNMQSGIPSSREIDDTQNSQLLSQVDHQQDSQSRHDAGDRGVYDDEILLDKILDERTQQKFQFTRLSVWMRTADGDEYTGPSSGISTISDLGLEWIRQNISNSEVLCGSILDIRNSVLGHLRQPKCIQADHYSAPGASPRLKSILRSDVTQYVDAYFSKVQTIFPILDRNKFEDQLAKYGTEPTGTNYSWHTLLNAVLASGCRAALSEETTEAFQVSGRAAWAYFRNAMYYQSKMANVSADLLGAQALTVMTVFAQGMSSPQRLEFTLSSAASRMAQSLALHHCSPPEWRLSEDEERERNRLFWVIYCLDKTIALRCGRPAILHDQEISCAFPHGELMLIEVELDSSLPSHPQKVDLLLCAVKLARICGMITEKLYSASGLHLPASELQEAATRILTVLETWRRSLPLNMRTVKPFGKIGDVTNSSRTQLLVLHSTYYYVLCAIYRRFTPMFTSDGKDCRHYVSRYSEISHMEAARSIILLTKFYDIESYMPGWLVFYYPFTALTTLFLHVVGNPSDESVRDDIALMEIVVGFFGRLEYITSGEAAFTKTTEFVRQARSVVASVSTSSIYQQHSGIGLRNNSITDPSDDSVGQIIRDSRLDKPPILCGRKYLASLRARIMNPIASPTTHHSVSPEIYQSRPMEKGDHSDISHHHNLPLLFFPDLPGSPPWRPEEIIDGEWLEDWMISTENA